MHSFRGYAVIDLETTGFNQKLDRVVEIAVVLTDEFGSPVSQWCTLINPVRDIGPTHIHGITSADVLAAPQFAEVLPLLCESLAGRVVVAHNAAFDAGFLEAEMLRGGLTPPEFPRLCTLKLASNYLRTAGRSLAACCEAAGLPEWQAHTALGDAIATAGLLGSYLRTGLATEQEQQAALEVTWPVVGSVMPALVTRETAARKREIEKTYIAQLVQRLPAEGADGELWPYLEVLDRVFQDRRVLEHEILDLEASANHIGLRAAAVVKAHEMYLQNLADVALSDGVLTTLESDDLHRVAQLLGLGPESVDRSILHAKDTSRTPVVTASSTLNAVCVVFTGDAVDHSRAELVARAEAAGMTVKSGVSRKVDMLVAVDSDTQSGKAQKARALGVPVIALPAFLAMTAHAASR